MRLCCLSLYLSPHPYHHHSQVGGGWVLYNDPQNNHPYYYNATTNESVWAEDFDASRRQELNVGSATATVVPPPAAASRNDFFAQEAEWTLNDKFERWVLFD